MSDILIKSNKDKEEIKNILKMQKPSYRQAYSDRTAWEMACLSELAYLRFNPLQTDKQKKYFIKKISNLISESSKNKLKSLVKLIDAVAYDHDAEKQKIVNEANILGYKLYKTFDQNGTQAILLEKEESIVLAFRGTEADSIKDIKSDAKAVSKSCDSGGKIHSGFDEAFGQVYLEIEETLNEKNIQDKPLFITGHSLGGALATIAAKKITHKGGNAACYTFGSPRVGDAEWVSSIKTPIYRVVNAADCVTMLPPSSEFITFFAWIFNLIPHFGKHIRSFLLSKFGGYLHGGNMRYIQNCSKNNYEDVKLLYSVSWYYRIIALWMKKLPWKKMLADHSITVYRKKLQVIARKRNLV